MLCLFSFQLFDIVLISGTRNVLCRRVQAISKKKGFTRASERLDNCPTRLCTTTVRNRLHYSVGIIRSKAMFANDAQKHFCTASAGNVDVL